MLSPLLSNLYLDVFDRAMLAAGCRVIRYGDDFAVPAGSRRDGERALVTAGTELSVLGLELNSGKSHVVAFEAGVRFLGETVTASTMAANETLSHPLETSVHVDRQGSLVRVRGDRLVVTDGDESLLRLGLRRVVCCGRVGLTTAARCHRSSSRRRARWSTCPRPARVCSSSSPAPSPRWLRTGPTGSSPTTWSGTVGTG